MNLFFWKKKSQNENTAYAPYEEIDAKRTSKLGYFFLVLMVIFGVGQGQNFLGALKNSITPPEPNSHCLNTLAQYADVTQQSDNYGSYDYYYERNSQQECNFSVREQLLSIDDLYASVDPIQQEIVTLANIIDTIQSQIYSLKNTRAQTISNYDVSLQEEMAVTENAVFNQSGLQNQITTIDFQIAQLQSELSKNEVRKNALDKNIKTLVQPYVESIRDAYDQYAHDLVIHEFKQFLISLVFIAPLFVFVWRFYHKAKERRSEYAIIWGGAVATIGIIFAQILLVFVYRILPHEIIQEVFKFLSTFQILWALLYWLGFILIPLFFGYLIYLIQKKFYNKKAVMMRALKNEHCPKCSLKINRAMNNCPVCGYTLKTKCHACGVMSMDGGAFCESCGVRRIPTEVVS